jgi:hypothetical protein
MKRKNKSNESRENTNGLQNHDQPYQKMPSTAKAQEPFASKQASRN